VVTVESEGAVVNVSGCVFLNGTLVVHIETPIDQSVTVTALFLFSSPLCLREDNVNEHFC